MSLVPSTNVQVCDDVIILHPSYLAYPHYIITVHIYGLQSVSLYCAYLHRGYPPGELESQGVSRRLAVPVTYLLTQL